MSSKKPNENPKKNTLLYTVTAVLAIAFLIMGTLTGMALKKLSSIQSQMGDLEQLVTDVSESSAALDQQAAQLRELQAKLSEGSDEPEISVFGEQFGPALQAPASEVTPESQSQSGQQGPSKPAGSAQDDPSDAQDPDAPSEEQSEDEALLQEGEGEGTISPTRGSPDTADEQMDNLMKQLEVLLPTNNGSWSVYVCNLRNDSEGALKEHPMQAASLIKLFIMGAVYENYDALIQTNGQENVDANLLSMITVSDNDAANTLVNWLGKGDNDAGRAVVNSFCKDHGYTNTSMGRMLLESKENGDNYTSVSDCGHFLREVYRISEGLTEDPSLSHADSMYYLLKLQERRNKIPAQLPEGVQVANKTGELDTVENDAGIIYDTAKDVDLVVCFMAENLTAVGDAQTSIAENSRRIYGYYNE